MSAMDHAEFVEQLYRARERAIEHGIRPSEGYYLVIIDPEHVNYIIQGIGTYNPSRLYQHEPLALFETIRNLGGNVVCVFGDLVIASKSPTARPRPPRGRAPAEA